MNVYIVLIIKKENFEFIFSLKLEIGQDITSEQILNDLKCPICCINYKEFKYRKRIIISKIGFYQCIGMF